MRRTALFWIFPAIGVQAEEELDILRHGVSVTRRPPGEGSGTVTHAGSIRQRTPHVTQKEVAEFYWV